MKKVLVIILVLLCVLALASCDSGKTTTTTKPPHVHTPADDFEIIKEPICGAAGYAHLFCETCGEILERKDLPATGFHVYSDWIEIQSGGCSAVSYRVQICEQCGHTIVDAPEGVDVVHPHEFELIMEEATCTLPGIEYRFECKNCHFVATEKYSLPLGHSLKGQGYKQLNEMFHTQVCTRCGEDVMEAHSLTGLTITDAPSCTSSGSASGTCDKCGESGDITIPALGHLYIGGECEYVDEEHHLRNCVRCEESIYEGHTVLLWKTVKEATCYKNGLDEGECISCGGHVERVTDDYHDYQIISYDSGSCTEGGSATYKCSMCGKTITVDGLAPGHIYYHLKTVTEPTCDKSGVGIKKCASCGEEKEYTLLSLGHNYSNGVTVKAADCNNDGIIQFTCQRQGCGYVKELTVAKSHDFDGGVVTLEPTCERNGEIVYTCKSCGVEVEYTIPARHSLTYHGYIAPTCTSDGQAAHYTCDDCGGYFSTYYSYRVYLEYHGRSYYGSYHTTTRYIETSYEKTVIDALGHSYATRYDDENHYRKCVHGCGEILDVEPHTLVDGFEVRTEKTWNGYVHTVYSVVECTKCGYKVYGKLSEDYEGSGGAGNYIEDFEPVDVLHEHFTYKVIPLKAPTCTEEGLAPGLKCGECGKILYEQEVIPALGHNFVNGVCTRCGLENGSQGLEYELNSDKQSYSIVGIGTCTDTDIVIPDTYDGLPVTRIGSSAFLGCDSLTSIVIPDSVTSIGYYAFYKCDSLTSVVIPDSVTSIGNSAFYDCDSLTSVVIPDSVTSIGEGAFRDCHSLISIEVDVDNEYYCSIDGNLYNKDATTLIQYSIGKIDTSFTIPDSVTSIGSYAFYDCRSLTSVVIPDSVTSIGDYAFDWCRSLTSIEIPDSVTSIGGYAFYGCDSLTSIEIPDSVTSIGGYAFWYCTSLTSVVIPDSVTSIGDYAFYCCRSLTSVVIPDSVTSIGQYAFDGCDSLTSIEVDEKNERYCSIDGNLYNKDATTLIQYAIGKTDTSFTIPDSVTSIGEYAFYSCYWLRSVVIPDSVTSIGDSAFRGCTSLTSVVTPDSVTSIGDYAFCGCTSLTSVVIPDSVTSIGDDAFYYCRSLTSVVIPDSVTSIGGSAFSSCDSLTSVEVDEDNKYYCSIDGNLYNKDETTLIQYAIGKTDTSFTIPDSVTSIGNRAFEDCTSLTSVEIPDSVTSIGDYAFRDCTSLTSVVIPDFVTSIGNSAFSHCYSLAIVEIGNSVTSIGEYAFYYCRSLTIYCEAESQPAGWNSSWNSSNRPVVWGYNK